MFNKTLIAVCCVVVPTASYAQVAALESSIPVGVRLYGVLDTAIEYKTHVATASGGSGSSVAMGEGFGRGSRFGLTGGEDLGGGLQAIFVLESGVALASGASDQQGQLFGRQAYVGLTAKGEHTFQTLTFGRQYGGALEASGPYDPFYHANLAIGAWDILLYGNRFDNAVEYVFNTGGLKAILHYSPGGQSSGAANGTTLNAGLNYKYSFANVGGWVDQSKDGQNRILKGYGAGLRLTFGPAILYGYYTAQLRDPGFSPGANNSGTALANASFSSNVGNVNKRRDNYFNLAAQYLVTPALTVTAMYKHDIATAVNSLDNSGTASSYLLIGTYSLSKRTSIYSYGVVTKLSGAEVTDPNAPTGTFAGKATRTQIGIGVTHTF